MPIYTLAYYKSSPSANDDVTAVPDPSMTISNGHFVLNKQMSLVAAYGGAAGVTDLTISAPSLFVSSIDIRPPQNTYLPPSVPNLMTLGMNPTGFEPQEEIQIQIQGTAGNEAATLLWLSDGYEAAPPGPSYNLIGNPPGSPVTPVQGQWTLFPVDWQNLLPAGQYAVIGCEVIGGNAIAGRLIFQDQVPRPGTLAMQQRTDQNHPAFLDGRLGVWGRFNAWAPPQLEVLAGGNPAPIKRVVIRVVRIGDASKSK